jgi:hypothetical protein
VYHLYYRFLDDEVLKGVPISSKKLLDLGFSYKALNLQRRLERCNEDLERSNASLLVGDNIKEVPRSN